MTFKNNIHECRGGFAPFRFRRRRAPLVARWQRGADGALEMRWTHSSSDSR